MVALVGYTGFVGSNIYAQGGVDKAYNSKNIADAYGTMPDLLIYAGLRAEKYLANTCPDADRELIFEAEKNIEKIAPKRIILISTIDVFSHPVNVCEDDKVCGENSQAYGRNRYLLEEWVRERFDDALIVRLPGLYGNNIKKNFIYDFINIIPPMLQECKFRELIEKEPLIEDYYEQQSNGFYRCKQFTAPEKAALKECFKNVGFTAINLTDSRNIYQFYPLSRLWDDMKVALRYNIPIFHPATEPISVGELYKYLTGNIFVNEIAPQPVYYNYRTKYAELFGGQNGYLMNKHQVLKDIGQFVAQSL